jgi:hypothetical protein
LGNDQLICVWAIQCYCRWTGVSGDSDRELLEPRHTSTNSSPYALSYAISDSNTEYQAMIEFNEPRSILEAFPLKIHTQSILKDVRLLWSKGFHWEDVEGALILKYWVHSVGDEHLNKWIESGRKLYVFLSDNTSPDELRG